MERACGGLDPGEHARAVTGERAGTFRSHAQHSLRCRPLVGNWCVTGGNRFGPGGVPRV
ncbi:hypothetical protein STRAU_5700 [Streptomyces aurantiacus JA 4570]|uniref:Uncharacterized protein n=1 Tax=Streptomyces aurantiacus JA 4570 TaxID=1286094 RepID=S3ZF23_9ACTN|nr:hypothetical protein STRAU_5700 [Streptomyces aurantiacus JA 4570]